MTTVYPPFPLAPLSRNAIMPDGTQGLFRRALGADFDRLHPMLQARFGIHQAGGMACIGEGMMTKMKPGNIFIRPFLFFGAPDHVLFPEKGEQIPFVIENYPYINKEGQESVTFVRTFYFPNKIRRFDAYMCWDDKRGVVKDYIGRKQRLVTDLHMEVDSRGHVIIRSGKLDWVLGKKRLPAWPGGYAEVEEWYDEADDCIQIRVSIAHPFFGRIYTYEGWFRSTFVRAEEVPMHVRGR